MTGAIIPVSCPHCGALFASRAIRISGNVRNLSLSGNRETCPHCGKMAHIVDGVFNFVGDVLSVVHAPNVTREKLAAFERAVKRAYKEKTAPEQLVREAEKIDPSFGQVVRKAGKLGVPTLVILLIVLAAIKSCSVDIKVDANRLIDQLTSSPPAAVISQAAGDE